MARMPFNVTVALAAMLVAACNRDAPPDKLKQAYEAGEQQSQQQAATDPARQPHPGDRNPLRRKLGDLQIRELFFGPDQTQGDWVAWLPCSQAHAGLPVAEGHRAYLKRCDALRDELLERAQDAGFADATADDVLDPRLSGARKES
ncbi:MULTISPECIES: hypothetical protein [Hydrocarboniphaga]|jgi:hypothetical protein|uniref:hypothetical protein n=1 Tax=Hydrocarboniphaga TaxID=243627 RepID=UPI002ABA810D|nr:hypothetical protein [Hydrocarboniphaga sp.]MDZ4078502.1 hypothetical protein [Hydrocarboniphaga sp.]